MMTWDWEETFAEENNRIRERMAISSFDEIRAAFQSLEQKILSTAKDEGSRLEVRRRVATWLLIAAIDMKRPFEQCELLLKDAIGLGFLRPQDRVTTVATFARYCLLSGRKADGYRQFQPAMAELEASPGVIASAPPALVEGYRRLLAQLESA
jgi:hypothetical protein